MKNLEKLYYREKVPIYTKLKPKPTEGRHLIKYKDEKDYDYYICDYCGDEIKILKKRIEMAGGVVVLPNSLTKRGEIKIVLHNKCINPVLKELEGKNDNN